MRRAWLLIGVAVVGVGVVAISLGDGPGPSSHPRDASPSKDEPDAARAGVRPAAALEGVVPEGRGSSTEPHVDVPPITGLVRDAGSGEPLPDAMVYAMAAGEVIAEAAADPQGEFELAVHGTQRYALDATAPGYAPAGLREIWTDVKYQAEPGDRVEIALELGLAIRGRVVDEAGAGLADALVRGTNFAVRTARRFAGSSMSGTSAIVVRTDAFGHFDMAEVPPQGTTTFRVTCEAYEEAHFSIDASAESKVREYVVRLQCLPLLEGRVVGDDGRPLAGAAIVPLLEGMPGGALDAGDIVVSADDGGFRVTWSRRAIALAAWSLDHVPVICRVGPDDLLSAVPLDLRLPRAAEVRGVVRDDLGRPVANARVRVHHYDLGVRRDRGRLVAPFVSSWTWDSERLKWVVQPRDGDGSVAVAEVQTDPNGRFQLTAGGRGDMETGLLVDKEGYVDGVPSWTEASPDLVIDLVRAGRLEVAATDAETAKPVADFRVSAEHPPASMRQWHPNPARGVPVVLFLAPGRVSVVVQAEGYAAETLELDIQPGDQVKRRFALRRP